MCGLHHGTAAGNHLQHLPPLWGKVRHFFHRIALGDTVGPLLHCSRPCGNVGFIIMVTFTSPAVEDLLYCKGLGGCGIISSEIGVLGVDVDQVADLGRNGCCRSCTADLEAGSAHG